MKVYLAFVGGCEWSENLSVHASKEGARAAISRYLAEENYKKALPPDWDGSDFEIGTFDYVKVDEFEVLP